MNLTDEELTMIKNFRSYKANQQEKKQLVQTLLEIAVEYASDKSNFEMILSKYSDRLPNSRVQKADIYSIVTRLLGHCESMVDHHWV